MSNDEIRVIRHLESFGADWPRAADVKAEELGMTKPDFLRVCRQLRDQGYAYLAPRLDDECCAGGSAYKRTRKGDALVMSFERAA